MVADGQMGVVRVQGLADAANQGTGVLCMVLADEEVGVVADAEWEVGRDVFQWEEGAFVVGFREALGGAER